MAITSLVAGCATFHDNDLQVDDPGKRDTLIRIVEDQYPAHFKSVHRATLTLRGRDFAVDGFLRVEESGYRFLASTGFGTALFELATDSIGKAEVVRRDEMLPEEKLLAGPATDIRAIYFQRPTTRAVLEILNDGRMTLTDLAEGGSRSIYTFDAAAQRWLTYAEVKRGRVVRQVQFDDFSQPDTSERSIPRRIHIFNRTQRYTVDIRVVTVTGGS